MTYDIAKSLSILQLHALPRQEYSTLIERPLSDLRAHVVGSSKHTAI